MNVTSDKAVRAARAREALTARHAGLQAVLDLWAGEFLAVEGADGVWALGDCAAVPDLAARNGAVRAPTAQHAYRHASAGSAASLGLYRGAAEVYGLRMRGFPARATHRPYHLLKLPTVNRRLRVISDWTLALLFPREVVSLDVLEHPRQDYEAALRVLATGSHRTTPLSAQEEKEDDYHAYRR